MKTRTVWLCTSPSCEYRCPVGLRVVAAAPCPACGGKLEVVLEDAPAVESVTPAVGVDGVRIIPHDACPRGCIIVNPEDAAALSEHAGHRRRFKLAEVIGMTKRMMEQGTVVRSDADVLPIEPGPADKETIGAFLRGDDDDGK